LQVPPFRLTLGGARAERLHEVLHYQLFAPQGVLSPKVATRRGNKLRLSPVFRSALTPKEQGAVGAALSRFSEIHPANVSPEDVDRCSKSLQIGVKRLAQVPPSTLKRISGIMDTLYELRKKVVERNDFGKQYSDHLDAFADFKNKERGYHSDEMTRLSAEEYKRNAAIAAHQTRLKRDFAELIKSVPDERFCEQAAAAFAHLPAQTGQQSASVKTT